MLAEADLNLNEEAEKPSRKLSFNPARTNVTADLSGCLHNSSLP